MHSILLLGSTGSIGTQTLELVRASPGRFRIVGLAAARSADRLLAQALEFLPSAVALCDAEQAERIRPLLPAGTRLVTGAQAAEQLAAQLDYSLCVHGMVGAAGVEPSARVLERGKTLALANKESLVVAGEELMRIAAGSGASLVPVDSEHAAIFQCLRGEDRKRVRCIYLTASGGPLRDLDARSFEGVTPLQALAHPNWSMGPRISVGSATLMNKALEVIEAHHLFGLAPEQIRVLVHRQSVVHSMVEFVDGSIVAQLGPPDMRMPIHYALHHPDRAPANFQGFSAALFRELTFEEPDPERFPALELGYRCICEGGTSGACLNAADEVAVEAFLCGGISFPQIQQINRSVLEGRDRRLASGLPQVLEADASARRQARLLIEERAIARAR